MFLSIGPCQAAGGTPPAVRMMISILNALGIIRCNGAIDRALERFGVTA
jgi:hypothetical protein